MKKDIRYVPSNPEAIEGVLELAWVDERDVVFDLGSGDGRVVIAAARRGARAIGVEIDASLIAQSRQDAHEAGLDELAEFRHENLFETDLRDATVVFLYLHNSVNMALLPKLRRELRPGTRLVSLRFDITGWEPNRIVTVERKPVFLWIV